MGRYVVCILRERIVIGIRKICSNCDRTVIEVSEVGLDRDR
jgi:hypothetical protein